MMRQLIVYGSAAQAETARILHKGGAETTLFLADAVPPDGMLEPGCVALSDDRYLQEDDLRTIDSLASTLSRSWFKVGDDDLSMYQDVSLGMAFQELFICRIVPILKNVLTAFRLISELKPDRIVLGKGINIRPGAWKAVAANHNLSVCELRNGYPAGRSPLCRSSLRTRLRRRIRTTFRGLQATRFPVTCVEFINSAARDRPLILFTSNPSNHYLYPALACNKRYRFGYLTESEHSQRATIWDRWSLEHHFASCWRTLDRYHRTNQTFLYCGVNLWKHLSGDLSHWVRRSWPDMAIQSKSHAKLLQRHSPLLLTRLSIDHGSPASLSSFVAKTLGIPTICVQHENMLPGYLDQYPNSTADYAIAWGEISKRWFVSKSLAPDNISLAAPPHFSARVTSDPNVEYKPSSAGTSSTKGRPCVVFAPGYLGPWTAWHSPLDFEVPLRAIVDVARDCPEFEFLIKLHPQSAHSSHEGEAYVNGRIAWLKQQGLKNIQIAPLKSKIEDYLEACEVLITTLSFSTTVIEALVRQKPVIILDTSGKKDLLPELKDAGCALFAQSPSDLLSIFQDALEGGGAYGEHLD